MCLAVPLRIWAIDGLTAQAEAGGLSRSIRIDFVPDCAVGDYVLVHAGFAIEKVQQEQAKLDQAAWEEISRALQ